MDNNAEDQRERLQESVDRNEQEFREAVQDLREAVRRPFRLAGRFAKNPLPWVIGAVLIGFYIAGRDGNEE